jgi:hypothetical protein
VNICWEQNLFHETIFFLRIVNLSYLKMSVTDQHASIIFRVSLWSHLQRHYEVRTVEEAFGVAEMEMTQVWEWQKRFRCCRAGVNESGTNFFVVAARVSIRVAQTFSLLPLGCQWEWQKLFRCCRAGVNDGLSAGDCQLRQTTETSSVRIMLFEVTDRRVFRK